MEVSTANSTALLFNTGRVPGMAASNKFTPELVGSSYLVDPDENNLVDVAN